MFSTISASTSTTDIPENGPSASSFAFTDGNGNTKIPTPINYTSPPREQAGPESQFRVEIAYAYVGPVPPDKISYYSKSFNQTMFHASKYPSSVFLSVTSAPSIQFDSCDAVIQVYGVKIAADTGPTEYYAWTIGTNYTKISQEEISILLDGSDDLIDRNLYRGISGSYQYAWAANQSVLSHKIGSVGEYTNQNPNNWRNTFDLSSAGTPNTISVEVRRIGYVTITNGSVALYEDTIKINEPVAYAQLSRYEDGFIQNNLVPTEQLLQIDLFHPLR